LRIPLLCAIYVVEAIGLPAGISGYDELHRQVFSPIMVSQLLYIFHNTRTREYGKFGKRGHVHLQWRRNHCDPQDTRDVYEAARAMKPNKRIQFKNYLE
jgi:hypothetical protein